MGVFSRLFGGRVELGGKPHALKRILVIEPSLTVRKVIELTMQGARLKSVETAGEASSALALEPFDLVMVAVDLPDGTGYAFCRQARSKGIKVILMRGMFESFDPEQAKCADSVLKKPFRSDALVDEVARLLG